MSVEIVFPLIMGGNPTDEEIAAIAAAYSAYLSINGEIAVDNLSDYGVSGSLWSRSIKLRKSQDLAAARPLGSAGSWSLTQRIRARK